MNANMIQKHKGRVIAHLMRKRLFGYNDALKVIELYFGYEVLEISRNL